MVTIATVLTVGVSAMMAYAFARLEFPGKEVVFYGLLLGMMIPPVMLIIPQFIIAKNLHLLNSLFGLIVVYISMNLSIQTFLLRGFFEGSAPWRRRDRAPARPPRQDRSCSTCSPACSGPRPECDR